MVRSSWEIIYDLLVFLTGIVVAIYSGINLAYYLELRNKNSGALTQNQVDGMAIFSTVVLIWAIIIGIWGGWKLFGDLVREDHSRMRHNVIAETHRRSNEHVNTTVLHDKSLHGVHHHTS